MIALEQLADGSASDRNFQKLMQLVLDTGGLSLKFRLGVDTLTWSASAVSADKTVLHGLGVVPQAVAILPITGLTAWGPMYRAASGTTTEFEALGITLDGASATGTSDFFWIAVG